ncbi:MAG: glucose-6-phosphate isomerase [Acidobacteria bacterium]|nr:MAG: glucose-6-phosphate isomerase [Acidobacteriota bacterium]
MPDTYHLFEHAPAVSRRITALAYSRFAQRLFRGDPSLWSTAPAARRSIKNRLGWLRAPERMLREVPRLESFAREARGEGLRQVVLLGMGGSSLCVEVFRRLFPPPAGSPDVIVLDGTVPEAVRRVESRLDFETTLFVVSSKSGTTAETAALQAYFWAKTRRIRGRMASRHFVAITDPGTPLSEEAAARGYRAAFHNAPDIGGRYSALSYFGLVPAALGGLDIAEILRRALDMLERCGPDVPASDNPGLTLGAALGTLARQGRDKVLLLVDQGLRPYELWIEQLLAESTGKDGRGLIPVTAPQAPGPLRTALVGADRVAVAIVLEESRNGRALRRRVAGSGTPGVVLALKDRLDLGASMLQWEVATAVAGAVLGVNPFDEPNVAESKKNTEAALEEFDATGRLREEPAALEEGRARVFLGGIKPPSGKRRTLAGAIRSLLAAGRPGDYLALLAYVDAEGRPLRAALETARDALLSRTGLATTIGHGPRYLHSTGQLHKGGPNTGLFIEVVPEDRVVLPIPGRAYDFETLKQTQALGDYRVLKRRGRRVLRLRYLDGAAAALRALVSAVRAGKSRAPAGRRKHR